MVASIRDVAQHAGVSVGTVSNVLNRSSKVSQASVERVLAAIEELGYVRNDAARQLRAGRSRTIGFVVLDVRNPFFTDVARGAERAAAERGFSVLLGNSDEDVDREAAYLDLFEEQRVQGVLISPYREVGPRLALLRERGTPAVLVDRRSVDGSLSSVSVDDVEGGRIAAAHLLSTGRRRLAFVGGPRDIRQIEDRLAGAEAAVAAVPGASLEVLPATGMTVAAGRLAAEALAGRPPRERPDAVFTANDLTAMGVLQGFHAAGIDVPRDAAIIGFDDIDFAAAAAVPISSIRQPREEMGAAALRILIAEAADPGRAPEEIVFQPELVVRESTRPLG